MPPKETQTEISTISVPYQTDTTTTSPGSSTNDEFSTFQSSTPEPSSSPYSSTTEASTSQTSTQEPSTTEASTIQPSDGLPFLQAEEEELIMQIHQTDECENCNNSQDNFTQTVIIENKFDEDEYKYALDRYVDLNSFGDNEILKEM